MCHHFLVWNGVLQHLNPLRPEDRENSSYAHKQDIGAATRRSPKGTGLPPSWRTSPSLKLSPEASANFRSPLKSPAFTVALALTSRPTNAPPPASITRSTSS